MPNTLKTFEIKENAKQRFHLQGFGKSISGNDGRSSFTLVVRKFDGQEIGRIENVTADDLGVGFEGEHYRNDTYRKTDLFIWAPGGNALDVRCAGDRPLLERMKFSAGFTRGASHLQAIGQATRVAIRPIPPKAEWPTWQLPSDEEIFRALKDITPYVRFIHPSVVERVVKQNVELVSFVMTMEDQGIQIQSYYWDASPCMFPGVRRFVGGTDSDLKKKIVPVELRKEKQAIYIDDNSYPKEIWSHLLRGRRFSNDNPDGYELAHLFIHKLASEIDIELELCGTESISGAISGFFTNVAGCAYIPKSLARVTDLNLIARKLIQKKCVEMYSQVCAPLPPGITLKTSTEDWSTRDFRWADPIGPLSENKHHVDSFLDFRRSELDRLVKGIKRSAA